VGEARQQNRWHRPAFVACMPHTHALGCLLYWEQHVFRSHQLVSACMQQHGQACHLSLTNHLWLLLPCVHALSRLFSP
jgi:hypothetical protein